MSNPWKQPIAGIEAAHGQYVAKRRAQVLCEHLASVIPSNATLLDVGCGDGKIAWMIGQIRPDLDIQGVDVIARQATSIPVSMYDGTTLPVEDDSCDVVTLIDVLHHCEQPQEVLREAVRVAKHAVVIKDHLQQGFAALPTLRLMDWVGNHRHGVSLPYNYWQWDQWQSAFDALHLQLEYFSDRLGLYPWPASLIFDRSLHFIAQLAPIQVRKDLTEPCKLPTLKQEHATH